MSDEPDMVNRPPHYADLDPEPIDVIEAWGLPFHAGNALKYIARAGRKPGASAAQDYRKAAYYLNRLADRIDARGEGPAGDLWDEP